MTATIETLNAAARQVGDLTAIITGGKLSSDQIPTVRAQAHALAVAVEIALESAQDPERRHILHGIAFDLGLARSDLEAQWRAARRRVVRPCR